MGTTLLIAIAIILASDMIMGTIMYCHYQRIDDRLLHMSERISEIKYPERARFIKTQRKDEIVFTEHDTPEQVIELMTQMGYRIKNVLVETMFSPNDKFWRSLNNISGTPAEGRVMFIGKRDNTDVKFSVTMCYDFKWLREWYMGGWQANI